MNLKHLKSFYWVSKLGTYSRAAEQLSLTESSVYRGVQSLERTYGVQLFSRDKGRVRLTPAGKLLYDYAEKIDALEGMADQLMSEMVTPAFVFGTTTLVAHVVGRCFAAWKSERPELRVGLVCSYSSDLYTRILAGELSFAFAPSLNLPTGLHSVETGFHDEVSFIARAGHPLSKRRLVSLSELAQEQVVSTSPATLTRHLLMEISRETGIRFSISIIVDNVTLLLDLVGAGAGIGLASKLNAAEAVKEGKISFITVEGMPRFIPWGFVMRQGVPLTEEANSLMLHLRSCLAPELALALPA
ncbi:MAG: LysR family transcriptional regulator [Chloroflexi bacterium]|nr:LysR family transcriptional regulator [Chloroflexota bacterium]